MHWVHVSRRPPCRQGNIAPASDANRSRSWITSSMATTNTRAAGISDVPVEGAPFLAPVPFDWRRASTQLVAGKGVGCRLRWRTPAEGVSILATPGYTAGHQSVLVEGSGRLDSAAQGARTRTRPSEPLRRLPTQHAMTSHSRDGNSEVPGRRRSRTDARQSGPKHPTHAASRPNQRTR